MAKDTDVAVTLKGGGTLGNLPPVFSSDAQFLFVICDTKVVSYAISTGKKYFEYEGLDKPLAGVGICVLDDTEYLVGCSIYGHVVMWKVSNGMKLKEKKLKTKVTFFKVVHEKRTEQMIAVLMTFDNGSKHLKKLNLGDLVCEDVQFPFTQGSFLVDVGGYLSETFVGVVFQRQVIFAKLKNPKVFSTMKHKYRFKCVACHPEQEVVATGDTNGMVILWYNSKPRMRFATYHWHTLPVRAVCFSALGTKFFSGGSECVLVSWDMHNHKERNFVPRLSGEIQQVAVAEDNLAVAVVTSDNAVHIYDVHRKPIGIVQHMVKSETFAAGITYSDRDDCLIMNGIVGNLQMYKPDSNQLLLNIDVVGMNKNNAERDKTIQNFDVVKVAVNRLGTWIATVEEISGKDSLSLESHLKFWSYSEGTDNFELNTYVDQPHDGLVTDVQFQTTTLKNDHKCVTIGSDKFFKVWELLEKETSQGKRKSWLCVSAVGYKSMEPTALAFSYDGSLMAIAYEQILTTWTPDSCENKCSLAHLTYSEPIHQMAFGNDTRCHLVVTSSAKRLSVWNLLTLTLAWTVELKVSLLIANLSVPHMAVITTSQRLFVFYPDSPEPIYQIEQIVGTQKKVLKACIAPKSTGMSSRHSDRWYEKSTIYFLDSAKDLYAVGARESDENRWNQIKYDEMDKSIFSRITPQASLAKKTGVTTVTHMYTSFSTEKKIKEFLSNPIHTMPPISLMCNSILSTMIKRKVTPLNEQAVQVNGSSEESRSRKPKKASQNNLSEVENASMSWVSAVF